MLHDFCVYQGSQDLAPLRNLPAFSYFLKHAFPMKEDSPFTYDFSHVLAMAVVWTTLSVRWPSTKTDIADEAIGKKPGKEKKMVSASYTGKKK